MKEIINKLKKWKWSYAPYILFGAIVGVFFNKSVSTILDASIRVLIISIPMTLIAAYMGRKKI